MIGASIIHLIFAITSGAADEATYKNTLVGVVGGIGLILAGDASQSAKQVEQAKSEVKTAIESGDTSRLSKPEVGTTPKP